MAVLMWRTRMVAGVAGVPALVLAAVLFGVGERLAVGMRRGRRARRAPANVGTPPAERSSTGGG